MASMLVVLALLHVGSGRKMQAVIDAGHLALSTLYQHVVLLLTLLTV
jgi:hypothetical protein